MEGTRLRQAQDTYTVTRLYAVLPFGKKKLDSSSWRPMSFLNFSIRSKFTTFSQSHAHYIIDNYYDEM